MIFDTISKIKSQENMKQMLAFLSSLTIVSGYERDSIPKIKDLFAGFCGNVNTDKNGNIISTFYSDDSSAKKILVTAHMDEVGLIVTRINERGFISFVPVGGVDVEMLTAQEVVIRTKNRLISGVIGAKPPHLMSSDDDKKQLAPEDMSIDTGLAYDQLKADVSIGDPISFKSGFRELFNNRVSGKALDNRSGLAVLLELARILHFMEYNGAPIKNNIILAATVREEFDLAGSITSAYNAAPDIGIVIDACHADMPDIPNDETCLLGKGPAIGVGPILDKTLTQSFIQIASDLDIPYQMDAEPSNTGTEAWALQVSRHGVRTALLSIPLRYMHTPVEEVQIDDLLNTLKLLTAFLMLNKKAGA